MSDTIAAISTPFGEGAIALLRLSGPRAVAIADEVFRGRRRPGEMRPRVQQLGGIFEDGQKLDDVLLAIHRAPASHTGEDVVEIACHGGVLVTQRILGLLLRSGARSAHPGEFTRRAYLNGKMDLTQAEAVMDLISAQTDLALRAAQEQLEGRLGEKVRAIREGLITLLAHVEAHIDFPDEDIDPDMGEALLAQLDSVRGQVESLLATAGQGKVLREGVRAVIYGAPNVGKSSLLNRLLGYDRAIVNPRPGTTRDVIEEVINLRGIPLRLMDTAGVRDSQDEVEQAGMEQTRRQLDRADLVLHVVDSSQPQEVAFQAGVCLRQQAAMPESVDEVRRRLFLVLNKIDLGEHESWRGVKGVRISCLRDEGLAGLTEAIHDRVIGGGTAHRDWSVAINARHHSCLESAARFADAARAQLSGGASPELAAEELRAALDAVGDIVGRADHDEILGRIFSTFCIGK